MAAGRFVDVWVNCPDRETAEKIAETLVTEKLAACANIFAPISSIYRWRGAIERADEVPLLLKTRAGLFESLSVRVNELHPYEVPSIVATELAIVEDAYAQWLAEETDR